MTLTYPAEAIRKRKGVTDGHLRVALLAGGLLLLLVGSYVLVIRPVVVPLAQQRSLLLQRRSYVARDRARLGTMGSLPAQLDSLNRELDRGSARLFTGSLSDAMTEFTTHAVALARSSHVALATVTPLESRTEGGLTHLRVAVRGGGNWASSLAFFHALSSATRLLTVQALRLERRTSRTRTDPGLVTFSATIVGYRRSGP